MTHQANYFAIIPAPILNHKGLSPSAKLFYAQITALVGQDGYCWASNGYFAEKNECSQWTITQWIKQLSECGFIHVESAQSIGNQRRIYLAETLPLLRKTPRPSLGKPKEGRGENPSTLLRKTQDRYSTVSKKIEIGKGVGESAPATGLSSSKKSDTSKPSGGGHGQRIFSESRWAAASPQEWADALVLASGIDNIDSAWYFSRVRDWSATKGATSCDWVATAAQFAKDDQRKSKLVTVKPATNADPTAILTNPLTGNTTTADRAARAAASAARVAARWANSGV